MFHFTLWLRKAAFNFWKAFKIYLKYRKFTKVLMIHHTSKVWATLKNDLFDFLRKFLLFTWYFYIFQLTASFVFRYHRLSVLYYQCSVRFFFLDSDLSFCLSDREIHDTILLPKKDVHRYILIHNSFKQESFIESLQRCPRKKKHRAKERREKEKF